MGKRKTPEQFISEAIKVHGDKYDYSKTKYVDYETTVRIICPKHGEFNQIPYRHLSGRGCARCNSSGIRRTILHNIATVDIIEANSPDNQRAYMSWIRMVSRCYDPIMLKKFPTYKDCSVCEEWLLFSNFKRWFDKNYVEGYDLDKDLLVKGNKVYSPETCCFIPHKINCIINKSQRRRGDLPIGVHYDKSKKRYCATLRCNMTTKFVGSFHSPLEAFNAYKYAKERYIRTIAEEYFQEGKITKKVYNALMKYKVEITD